MKRVLPYLAVGVGGFFGAVARHGVNGLFGGAAPVATFAVNISGSLLLGWFLTLLASRGTVSERTDMLRLVVGVGFAGAYTTFSTFSMESLSLMEGAGWMAMGNVIGSVVAGVVAVRVGMGLGEGTRKKVLSPES